MTSDDFDPAITGVGIYLQRLCAELLRRGHRLSVVTSRQGRQPAEETRGDLTVHRTFSVPIAGFYQALPSARTLRDILAREKPDVVHHHYVGLLMRRTIAAARGRPQVATHHFGVEVLCQPLFLRPFRSRL